MHTIIYGPPGTGKTEAAKLMGKNIANWEYYAVEHFAKSFVQI